MPGDPDARTVQWNALASLETLQKASPCSGGAALRYLGRFELLEVLGEGAYGTVYRANDPELQRDVALKIPRSGALLSDDEAIRFLREARAAGNLRHPNIVPVYAAGIVDETYFIASGLIGGRTLRALLRDESRPAVRELVVILTKVAKALHYAHVNGIVHRDVKPENIMVDETGEPQVMDFGLARRESGDGLQTQEGIRMGTPAYMSPEQAQGKSHLADARSDLWSLGVMLYECLTAQRPFTGKVSQMFVAICEHEPMPPRKIDRRVPRDLETICLKCLRKEPGQRYATVGELADELQRWLDGRPVAARAVSRVELAWRWARRNPGLATTISAVVLLLAAMATGSTIVAAVLRRSQNRLQDAVTLAQQQEDRAIAAADEFKALSIEHEQQRIVAERTLEDLRKAEVARKQLERETEAADAARQAAEKAASSEEKARREADEAAQQAEARRKQLLEDPSFRFARISQLVEGQEFENALAMLDDYPANGRSWEWYYLRDLCRRRVTGPIKLGGMEIVLKEGAKRVRNQGVQQKVRGMEFSSDAARLWVASDSARVWDTSGNGQVLQVLGPYQLPMAREGNVAVRKDTLSYVVVQLPSLAQVGEILVSATRPTITLSPDGSRVLVSGVNPSSRDRENREYLVQLFRADGKLVSQYPPEGSSPPAERQYSNFVCQFSENSRWWSLDDRRKGKAVFSSADGRPVANFQNAGELYLHPDGDVFAVRNEERIELWGCNKRETLVQVESKARFHFSPRGRWLVMHDGADTKFYDSATGKVAATATTSKIQCAFDPTDTLIASRGEFISGLRKVDEPTQVVEFAAEMKLSDVLQFSSDGKLVAATTSQPAGFAIYDATDGSLIQRLLDRPVRFSNDNRRVFCTHSVPGEQAAFVLSLVDVATGQRVIGFPGVYNMHCFSADGTRLAAATLDHQVYFWSAPLDDGNSPESSAASPAGAE